MEGLLLATALLPITTVDKQLSLRLEHFNNLTINLH